MQEKLIDSFQERYTKSKIEKGKNIKIIIFDFIVYGLVSFYLLFIILILLLSILGSIIENLFYINILTFIDNIGKTSSILTAFGLVLIYIFIIVFTTDKKVQNYIELKNNSERVLNILSESKNKSGLTKKEILDIMKNKYNKDRIDNNVFTCLQNTKGGKWIDDLRITIDEKEILEFKAEKGEYNGGRLKGYDIGPLIIKNENNKYFLTYAGKYILDRGF